MTIQTTPPPLSMTTANSKRERRLALAIGLNVVIVVVQVVFGVVAHSLGLLADASHNLTDVAALALSLIAIRLARRRANAQRSFGYHRATTLAAQANAASILAITVFIVYEGVKRLLDPEPVRGGVVLVVASIAAVANLMAVLAVKEGHGGHNHNHAEGQDSHHSSESNHEALGGRDLNMQSAMLHLVGDTAASVGVAVAGSIMLLTGRLFWLDPAVSIVIGILIARHAWALLRSTTDVLLESTPVGVDTDNLLNLISAVDGVEQVHDLHVWSLSSEVHAMSAHVVVQGHPTLEEAQLVANAVKTAIKVRFAISHATIELECETCAPSGDWCAIDQHESAALTGDQR